MKSKLSAFTIFKCVLLIIGVIGIPVLYSYFYLDAFWNPYNSLDKLPVAVVNEDSGAVINGSARNLGSEMVDRLKSNQTLKWIFTDKDTAKAGVDGKKYYAYIDIPKNFSQDVASASTTDKKAASLTYSANEKRNYLAAQILNRAVVELEEQTRSSVNKEITSQLTAKLNEVPSSLNELNDGLGQLSSGASTLNSKMSDASSGASSLNSGLTQLSPGAKNLSDGNATLYNKINELDTGIGQLQSGSHSLLAKFKTSGNPNKPSLYDAITGIAGGASQIATKVNQESSGNQATFDQLKTGTQTYVTSTDSSLYGMVTAEMTTTQGQQTVSGTISGLSAATQGYINANRAAIVQAAQNHSTSSTVMTNLTNYVNLYDIYNTAFHVAAGGGSLTDFVSTMKSGSSSAYCYSPTAAGDIYDADISKVVKNINDTNIVASGDTLSSSVETGVGNLSQNLTDLGTKLNQLSGGAADLSKQLTSAQSGSDPTLFDAVSQISSGLDSAKSGSSQILDGAQQLADGAKKVSDGAQQLSSGASQLNAGISALKDGSSQLAGGLSSANTKVTDKISSTNSELASTQGLDTYAENPVSIKQTAVNPVPNYGTAFAPYFMSLSMWVGAIITLVGIYLDPTERIRVLSRHSDKRIFRLGMFFVLGLAQALLLAVIVQFGLHLTVNCPSAYYLACILISFTFLSIVQFLVIYLKDVGKFLAIAFLILQLTSCAGTFPMETVPKIFNFLYPYMPMSYSVGLLKEAISGLNKANTFYNAFILVAIMAVFISITALFSASRKATSKVKEKLKAQTDTTM